MAQLTMEQRIRLARAMEIFWITGARKRDPDSALRILECVIADLRNGAELSTQVRAYLADALEHAVSDPKKAGHALGLVGKRARPNDKHAAERDRRIVKVLESLKQKGFKPNGNRQGNSTFFAVAELFRVSEPTVQRAWEKHTKLLRELRKLKAASKSTV